MSNLIGSRKEHFKSDYSRSYLFSIDIPAIESDSKKLSALCRATKLPDFEINTSSTEYDGIKINLAESVKFPENWRIEFFADDEMILKRRFLQWMSLAVDPARMVPSSPTSYKLNNIKASQLNRKGQVVMTYSFNGAFPVKVDNTANFSHKLTSPSDFTVELKFDFFTMYFA